MKCTKCQQDNSDGSHFCQFCGTDLLSTSQPSHQARQAPPLPNMPLNTTSQRPFSPPFTASPIGQLGQGGEAFANIWGPFAGYGMRGRHAAWLLDDVGEKAEVLHKTIHHRFNQRQVPASQMDWTTLVAKGLLVEQRPFFLIQRGITTVALYIARFGKDLYISQVTYIKGPFSNIRIALVGLMLLFWLYFVTGYRAALTNSFSFDVFGGGAQIPFFLLCVMGPLGVLNNLSLLTLLLYSCYKWVQEKDFLAFFRQRPNEFEFDDMVALEETVEETVRQSLTVTGIDANLMTERRESVMRILV